MRRKVKDLLLVLLILTVTLLLSSCYVAGSNGGTGGEGSTGESGGEGGTGEEGGETGGEEGGTENEENDNMKNGETLYYSKSQVVFISAIKSGSRDASDLLKSYFEENLIGDGGLAFIGNIYIPIDKYQQVVVGYVPEIEISVKANELLEQMESSSPISESRYLIYAENGNLAIAYDENTYTPLQTATYVAERFIEEKLSGNSTVLLEKGVQDMGTINLIEYQEMIDEQETESRWQAVREKLGDDDVYLAFRSFFEKMFSDEIIEWAGSLYDPATGMFYSSTSGKRANVSNGDTGYYPHPEATAIVLGRLKSTGMLRNLTSDYTKILPKDMQYKIVYYLKAIQDPNDGEFYVSQMNKSTIAPERVGRDHSRCTSLLSLLHASPTYDVGGYKGDGVTADEYWADLVSRGLTTDEDKPMIYWHWTTPNGRITSSLNADFEAAVNLAVSVSSVQGAASDSVTSYFDSHDAFISHLLTKDPYNSPYGAISNISSIAGMVNIWSGKLGAYDPDRDPTEVAKTVDVRVGNTTKKLVVLCGDTLNDINVSWMNLYINESGLFGKVTNRTSNGEPVYDGFYGGWGYNNTNGFMKGIGRYDDAGLAYPEPMKAAESLLKAVNSPESAAANGNILVIYNVWSCLLSLISNVKKYCPEDEAQEIIDYIYDGLYGKVDFVTGKAIDRTYAAIAIENAYEKIQPFKKSDAGYGHSPSSGTPGWQGNLPVGIASENLSDTDATFCTTTSLGSCISGVLGLNMSTDVPMHTEADLLMWLDTVLSQEYVIKKTPYELKYPKANEKPDISVSEMETFDELSDKISLLLSGETTAEITEKDGESVLHFSKEKTLSSFSYRTVNKKDEDPTVTVIGLDLLVDNVSSLGGIEIYPMKDGINMFLPYLRISGTGRGSKLMVQDHSSGMSEIASGITVGSWASVQFIYYGESQKYDFYVNDKFVMTGSYLRSGTEYPSAEEINGVKVNMNSSNVADFYFDNLYIYQLKK